MFDARPGHGKQVRDWIARVAAWHACSVEPDDAALLVSELFANALMHGPKGGRVLVGYCLWPGGARIVVCDGGGATTPRLRDPSEMDEGGRGLQVVDAVAAAWGSFRAGPAQAVWCDLGKPLDGSADSETRAWLLAILAAVALAQPPATTAVVGDWPVRASAGRHRSFAPACGRSTGDPRALAGHSRLVTGGRAVANRDLIVMVRRKTVRCLQSGFPAKQAVLGGRAMGLAVDIVRPTAWSASALVDITEGQR